MTNSLVCLGLLVISVNCCIIYRLKFLPSLSSISTRSYDNTTTATTKNIMNNKENSFLVRDATHEDYFSVINIDEELYMGRDYLTYTYHRLLDAPHTKAVVCETGGQVIGYAAGHVVDGGNTLVLSSGRVKSSHRGQGYTKRMLEIIRDYLKCHDGHLIKQEVLVTKGSNLIHTKTSLNEQYSEVLQKVLVNFIILKYNPHGSQRKPPYFNESGKSREEILRTMLIPLNKHNATTVMSAILSARSCVSTRLFGSSEFVVTNWTPYAISPQNAEDITISNNFVLLSGIGHLSHNEMYYYTENMQNEILRCNCDDSDVAFDIEKSKFKQSCQEVARTRSNACVNSKSENIISIPVLSTGNYFPCKLGLAYNIDLYFPDGTHLSDCVYRNNKGERKAIAQHLHQHILCALRQGYDKVHLIVFVSAEGYQRQKVVCDVMEQWFGLQPEEWNVQNLHLYKRVII